MSLISVLFLVTQLCSSRSAHLPIPNLQEIENLKEDMNHLQQQLHVPYKEVQCTNPLLVPVSRLGLIHKNCIATGTKALIEELLHSVAYSFAQAQSCLL